MKPLSSYLGASNDVSGFLSMLFSSRDQAHVFHLQYTGPGSYAGHKALDDYYNGIIPLVDELVESYQGGSATIVTGYKLSSPVDFTSTKEVIAYFEKLLKAVETGKTVFKDSDLLNIIDEIKTLIKSTLYKLKNLS